jgi:AraC family carnitine catabolism transcriptional activator
MVYVSFVLFPGFPMLAYALAREALDLADRLSPEPLFQIDTRVPGHQPARASNGALIEPDRTDWEGSERVDLTLVICGDVVPKRIPNGFQAYLARVDEAGGRLGAVAGGTLILARIGRLDGHRAVVQRSTEGTESFPAIEVCDRPYTMDDRRLTAAGGLAVCDAICAWIGKRASPALGQEVARALATGRMPAATEAATPLAETSDSPVDPVIAEMEARMRAHLDAPLPLTELAEGLGMSRKALRGRCERAWGVKPSEHYLALRLRHGAELLRHTAMPVSEIARASGFETLAGFSRAISNSLGVSPSAMRKMARAARVVSAYA